MALISVEDALAHIFALVAPLPAETVALTDAAGRTMARALTAARSQPPFAASAMDGYAVRGDDVRPGARLRVVGEAAAGARFAGLLAPGEAVRIFTGAPVPEGADRVVIQEDVTCDGDGITVAAQADPGPYIRPAGDDFAAGDAFRRQGPLRPVDIAMLASMNHGRIAVIRRPEVALIATGNELVMPGEDPGADQIVASNTLGLAAMIAAAGGVPRLLPIARDDAASLDLAFDLARGADLIVTVGGASVGDHDLVGRTAAARGMERAFYKVAMRPGKPLMAGRLDGTPLIGLPGNPVSALVCGHVFLLPVLATMLGAPPAPAPRHAAPLAADIPANGPREHYARAVLEDGALRILDRQDSALLGVLSRASALAVRPPGDPARIAGGMMAYLPL